MVEDEHEAENKVGTERSEKLELQEKKIWKQKRLKTDREEGDRRSRFIFINLFSPLAGHLPMPQQQNSVLHKTSVKPSNCATICFLDKNTSSGNSREWETIDPKKHSK